MNRIVPVTALAIAAAFVAPAAMATWMSGGTFEPDSSYDVGSGYNWEDAPGANTKRIYFNVYQSEATYGSGSANPNVGALRTQFTASGNLYFEAHLGVWTDCNGDGYIGMAESAVREYRAELLAAAPPAAAALCPAKSGGIGKWPDGANNYNGWVTELIPILRAPGSDARAYRDANAIVWGDFGAPVPSGPEFSAPAAGGGCPLTPLPRGFWSQTGGAIDYTDCHLDHTLGETYNFAVITAGQDGLALDNSDTWIQPGHPLNQPTFGSGKSDDAMIKAQDCSRNTDEDYIVNDDNQGLYVRPAPANPVNPSGSIAGSYNHTTEAVREDCRPSQNDDGDFYALLGEGDQAEDSTSRKTASTFNFDSGYMARGGIPFGVGTGSAGAPSDAGIDVLGGALIVEQAEWRGNVTYVASTPDPTDGTVTRGSVQGTTDDTTEPITDATTDPVTDPILGEAEDPATTDPIGPGDIRPANATYASFYAYVPGAIGRGFQVPSSGGFYAAAFCPTGFGPGAGVHWGWECDASAWYKLENGEPVGENEFKLARPGQAFHLRDVDCWDGSFSADEQDQITAGIEPAFYGENPC